MFCTNCGEKANGRFCAHCGTPVETSSPAAGLVDGVDWQDESRYQVLLHFPEVRDLIARHAPPPVKGITGEDFLKICDAFSKPLTGLPISISKLTAVVVPIYAPGDRDRCLAERASGSADRQDARRGPLLPLAPVAPLKEVHQGENGCVIEASLPPSLKSYEGQIVLAIERQHSGTLIDAKAKIPGQKYDWGVSKKCIEELFEDLHVLLN